MTTHYYLLKCVLPSTSGLPTDVYVTDWAFRSATADDGTFAQGYADLMADHFWNWDSGSDKIAALLSSNIDRSSGACQTAMYDVTSTLAGGPTGSPSSVGSFTLDAGVATQELPEEVTACLSIAGDLTGIPETSPNPAYPPTLPKFFRPAARRRGRLNIGPWEATVLASAGGHVFLSIGLQNLLVAAAEHFSSQFTPADAMWCVWSRADATFYDVVGGFVDNAFDTIRSRGSEANGRTSWLVP